MITTNNISYITKEECEILLMNCKKIKHRLLILLMMDAGLRVSEACSLKLKNFNFKKKILHVKSLKKRTRNQTKKNEIRHIPISHRLYKTIADYINIEKIQLNPDSYLFPSYSKKGHYNRKTAWRILKKYGTLINVPSLHPHMLRHSFATHHIANGTKLHEVKEMLGHTSYDTTLIYTAIPLEKLKERIHSVTAKQPPFYIQLYHKLFPEKRIKMINLDFKNNYFTIGRNEELTQLSSNAEKGINTILIGDIGTGKSHLLNNLVSKRKILHLDDTESIKKSLISILLLLHKGNKEAIINLAFKAFSLDEIKVKVQRENTMHICDIITSIVDKKEYILIIDDISKITPTGRRVLERLKDTFVIICAARQVYIKDSSFLWNFEQMKVKNLNRSNSVKMIQQLSTGLDVEDWELFRNHVYEQTNGNPRAITEIIDRYRKEPFITNEIVKEVRHTGALPEIDMTIIIVLFLGVITVTRYMSRELDEPALRFIGSIALIILLISRPLWRQLRRNFI